MKLKQIEYCHNCNNHVEFVFDDIVGKQVIICPTPKCGHKHYREIDECIITSVRLQKKDLTPWTMIHIPDDEPLVLMHRDTGFDIKMPNPRQVIGITEDGYAITDAGPGKKNGKKIVTQRRWGQDSSQAN